MTNIRVIYGEAMGVALVEVDGARYTAAELAEHLHLAHTLQARLVALEEIAGRYSQLSAALRVLLDEAEYRQHQGVV